MSALRKTHRDTGIIQQVMTSKFKHEQCKETIKYVRPEGL